MVKILKEHGELNDWENIDYKISYLSSKESIYDIESCTDTDSYFSDFGEINLMFSVPTKKEDTSKCTFRNILFRRWTISELGHYVII